MKISKLYISFIFLIYLEIIYHVFVFGTFEFKGTIFLILFTTLASLVLNLLTNLFNKKWNKRFFISIYTFITVVFCAQFVYFKFYGNIISIYSMIHGGQVFGFLEQILKVIKENILAIILLFTPNIILFIFNKKIICNKYNKKNYLIYILTMIAVYFISIISLNIDSQKLYSAKNLYYYRHVPNQSVQKFGIITTMRLDLQRTITNFEETIDVSKNILDTETLDTSNNTIEYNKLNIDFEKLNKTETNEDIKKINTYMSTSDASNKNEYTGLFENKNLIVLTAEGFNPIAVNKEITPTLYKLVNNGFNFTNFYTPLYYVSTYDGEYVNLTSLLPKENVWSLYKSRTNYLPYTYGNVFKNLGYTTYAFHNGNYKYYDRDKSHPNMGYTYIGCGNGLETKMNCNMWPQSDIEMMNATIDYYINENKFMIYYMTISGHLNYNFYGNNIAYKNKELVQDLPYSDAIKAYYATQIELDKALEVLIQKLEEKGKLNDTVIVLSADHYPYGLNTNELKEVMTINDEKFDIHKNHLIIWNNSMTEPIKVNKLASSLDILPTVLNLFGIEFDSRLLMGRDILSSSENLVILNDRSWISDKGTYDAATNKFTKKVTEELDEDYIDKINNIVYSKSVISKNILDLDYYKYIFKGE